MTTLHLKQPILTVAANTMGRDFVVGDLHGSLALLERSLHSIAFNKQQDRLFCVGDLIDRGRDSQQLIEWLANPWFHACMGNHEAVMLDYVATRSRDLAATWQQFGGGWFFDLPLATQRCIAKKVRDHCHFAIEIQSTQGTPEFGIVHADVPYQLGWQEFKQALMEEEQIRQQTLWSRERGRGDVQTAVEGIGTLVCGHEIVVKAHKRANVWLLDTGAYLSGIDRGKLSILELPETLHEFSE